jgi:hypothetical protein
MFHTIQPQLFTTTGYNMTCISNVPAAEKGRGGVL